MSHFSDFAKPRDSFAVRGRRIALFGIKSRHFDRWVGALFADAVRPCECCSGTGLENEWDECRACHGFRSVYTVSATELEFRRLLVKLRAPDALIEGWRAPTPLLP